MQRCNVGRGADTHCTSQKRTLATYVPGEKFDWQALLVLAHKLDDNLVLCQHIVMYWCAAARKFRSPTL